METILKKYKFECSLFFSFLLLFGFSLLSLKDSYDTEMRYRHNYSQYQEMCVSKESSIPSDLCEVFLEGDYETSFEDVFDQTITFQGSFFSYFLLFFVFIPVCLGFWKKKFSRKIFLSLLVLPLIFSFLFFGVYFIVKDFADFSHVTFFFLRGFFVTLLSSFVAMSLGYLVCKSKKQNISFFVSFILLLFLEWLILFFLK